MLEWHAAVLPLDGEIVFPTGAAVSWKEWLGAGPARARVLVKDAGAVRLAHMADLLATLEAA
jgi:phosphoribosyl-dephospho-CoA transferase